MSLNLKVFFIRETEKLIKNELKTIPELGGTMLDYRYMDGFHCFKFTNDHSIKGKGVEKENHEFVNGMDFFADNQAERLVSLAFVLINANNGYVYSYNYATKKIERLIKVLFQLTTIDTKVDIDKLQAITKIEVKLRNDPQLSMLYDNTPLNGTTLLQELDIQDKAVEVFTARYELNKKGVSFRKNDLLRIIGKYENLTIEGIDANDNIIKIKDTVQLEIKINISDQTFEEQNAISFVDMIEKIKEKEGGALREY